MSGSALTRIVSTSEAHRYFRTVTLHTTIFPSLFNVHTRAVACWYKCGATFVPRNRETPRYGSSSGVSIVCLSIAVPTFGKLVICLCNREARSPPLEAWGLRAAIRLQ